VRRHTHARMHAWPVWIAHSRARGQCSTALAVAQGGQPYGALLCPLRLTLLSGPPTRRKEQWGQTVKTPRFWQSDAAAATVRALNPTSREGHALRGPRPTRLCTASQVTWQLNPLMKRLPGRREAYPEQH